MRLRLRLLLLIIASFFRQRQSLADENVVHLRVLPNDVDVTRISNDRYFALMDLGRINIVLRAGLLKTLVANRWAPVMRFASMRFRHSLSLFQAYQLRSRAVYWDAEWVWTEHVFERNGRTIAIGLTKSGFVGPGGMVPVSELIAKAGETLACPALPKLIADLESVEGQIKEKQK
jgi:acyl-CoA thioesterase FadM